MTARFPRRLVAVVAATVAALAPVLVGPSASADALSRPTTTLMTLQLRQQIQHALEQYRSQRKVAGAALAVVTPGATPASPEITTFTSGRPAWGAATEVTPTTQWEIGSQTKTFTADLLASLVASGRVSLDDPLQDYAPPGVVVPTWGDPADGGTVVTLGDLATHQGGLTDVPPNFAAGCGSDPSCVNPRPGYTRDLLWHAFDGYQLLWQPGTNYLYSNWGFALLGTVLADLVQPVPDTQPPAYQSVLQDAFLDPLGLDATVLDAATPNLATGYNVKGHPAFPWDNTNAFAGGGGLISDVDDMAVWTAAHLGYVPTDAPAAVLAMRDTLTPVRTITRRCTDATTCLDADFQMGLAWQLYPATNRNMGAPYAFKDGGTAGFGSTTVMAPTLGIGVTSMSNRNQTTTFENDDMTFPVLALLVAAATETPVGSTDPPGPPTTDPTGPVPAVVPGAPELAATGTPRTTPLLALAAALLVAGVGVQVLARRPRQR